MASPAASVGEEHAGIGRTVVTAWPLLVSILLLMTGSGLQGTLLGVRAEQAAFDSTVTGLVLGLYYLGYVAGSAWVPSLIRSVGHIRVFSALASIASAAVVVHGVWVSPAPWVVLRFMTGVCIAGLFVVSESWLNDVSTGATRATLLAVYNTVVTAGLAVGSLLLNVGDTAGVVLFVVGSVLLSVAAVPVTLAPHQAPIPETSHAVSMREVIRAAPLGMAGATMSGLGTGAALGFGAVYATRAGFGVSGASQFVATVLVGAVVGQIPLGRWSDRTDRRIVMGAAAVLVVAGAVVGIAATNTGSFTGSLVAATLIGAGAFSLYGLSFAHMADYIEPTAMVSAGASLITANGLGAASGPFLASVFISSFGPEGLFQLLVVGGGLFSAYVVVRLVQREAASEERRAHYVAVAAGATVAALEDVVSENVGMEPSELRRRRARLVRRRAGDRPQG
jgi:MFS family permease